MRYSSLRKMQIDKECFHSIGEVPLDVNLKDENVVFTATSHSDVLNFLHQKHFWSFYFQMSRRTKRLQTLIRELKITNFSFDWKGIDPGLKANCNVWPECGSRNLKCTCRDKHGEMKYFYFQLQLQIFSHVIVINLLILRSINLHIYKLNRSACE